MDPQRDLERELADAINIDPAGDFTARIRARIANEPPASTAAWPRLLLPAFASVLIVMAVATMAPWRSDLSPRQEAMLSHNDVLIVSVLAGTISPVEPTTLPREVRVTLRPQRPVTRVLVAASEMRELQRLFAGEIVAPPPLPAPGEELSIPELTIAPIAPFPERSEGVRQ